MDTYLLIKIVNRKVVKHLKEQPMFMGHENQSLMQTMFDKLYNFYLKLHLIVVRIILLCLGFGLFIVIVFLFLGNKKY